MLVQCIRFEVLRCTGREIRVCEYPNFTPPVHVRVGGPWRRRVQTLTYRANEEAIDYFPAAALRMPNMIAEWL